MAISKLQGQRETMTELVFCPVWLWKRFEYQREPREAHDERTREPPCWGRGGGCLPGPDQVVEVTEMEKMTQSGIAAASLLLPFFPLSFPHPFLSLSSPCSFLFFLSPLLSLPLPLLLLFLLRGWGMEPRTLYMSGIHSITKLHPSPIGLFLTFLVRDKCSSAPKRLEKSRKP